MTPTLETIEARAKNLSQQGVTLKLEEADGRWHWHLHKQGLGIFNNGNTNAATKAVAFTMAMGLL